MSKYKYTGSDERVFPTLGVTVKSGDTFESSDTINAADIEIVGGSKPATQSAASDTKVGE